MHDSKGAGRDQPLDALLAGFAAGSLSPSLHRLVAAHLAIKPDNRRFVRMLEESAARQVEAAAPVPVKDREARLDAIFSAHDRTTPARRRDGVIPAPLVDFIGGDLADLEWKTLLPGIREHRVSDTSAGEASLLWIKPGRVMPAHTHEGMEVTLVLKGGFSDATGHYRRGDIAIADNEVDHRPRADEDEDCICFAVTDAPLRLTGPVGRIMQRLFGH
jgi:putative transcriptional regulator